jgi:nicotinamide-nucleotide amidase
MSGFDASGVHLNARQLGELLLQKNLSMATAESCTGGLLSGALTSVPGSSGWYEQGWVTYTNKAKMAQLGVCPETLRQFGAVSEPVARQMAAGALAMSPRASLALSTTGIAGPGGGSEDKPVGLVWFAFAQRIDGNVVVTAARKIFSGSRDEVRRASVEFSIARALELMQPPRA